MLAVTRNFNRRNLRYLPAFYFAAVGVFSLVMDLTHDSFSWPLTAVCLFLCLPAVFRNKWVYLSIGPLLLLIFGYLLIVVSAWFARYMAGAPVNDPLTTFGVGYTFVISSFIGSIFLVMQGLNDYVGPQKSMPAM
jgi:hypothetical protein